MATPFVGILEATPNKEEWFLPEEQDGEDVKRVKFMCLSCPVPGCKTWNSTGKAWSFESEDAVRAYAKWHFLYSKQPGHEMEEEEAEATSFGLDVVEHVEDKAERDAYRKQLKAKDDAEARSAARKRAASGPIPPAKRVQEEQPAEWRPLPPPPPLDSFAGSSRAEPLMHQLQEVPVLEFALPISMPSTRAANWVDAGLHAVI